INTVTVADAPLSVGPLAPPTVTEGQAFVNRTIFTFTDANPFATASDYFALVTLGDGHSLVLTSTPSARGQIVAGCAGFIVHLPYTYAEELSNQTFGVMVNDGDGSSIRASISNFNVADAPLTTGALTPPDSGGAATATFAGGLAAPAQLAFDAAGDLYVANL